MKRNLFLIAAVFSALPFFSKAQTPVLVEEVIKEMSKGMQNGYEVMVPEVTLRSVKSDFGKYLRKDSKGKLKEEDGEGHMTMAVNKNISPNPFTVYYRLLESESGVRINAFFADNDSASFYSTAVNPDQSSAIKKYLKDFAVKEYKEVVSDELESQKRKQKSFEGELESLIKSKQRSEKNISEAKRTIENNKKDIVLNNQQDTTKAAEVIRQKQVVASLRGTGGEEEKLANKNLKNLEGDKRKLEKEKESLEREIDKMNARIEDEQRNIENNIKLQADKNNEINNQKEKVKKTEDKLGNIN